MESHVEIPGGERIKGPNISRKKAGIWERKRRRKSISTEEKGTSGFVAI